MKDEDFLEQKRKIMMGGLEEQAEAEALLEKEISGDSSDDGDEVEEIDDAEIENEEEEITSFEENELGTDLENESKTE